MHVNPELRANWRTSWLNSIHEFADDVGQRRLWRSATNANPHYSFVECVFCYFDGLALSDGYQEALNEGLVTHEEVAAVTDFHEEAQRYESPNGDYDHEAILADAKWADVVSRAKRARAMLTTIIDDPLERRSLKGP